MLCSNHGVTDPRATCKQAASLARAGHEVIVFAMEDTHSLEVPNLTLQAVAPFRIGIRARFSMIPKLYRAALAWKPDVVTGHEPETARIGLELRKRCGAKVIFDVHELWHEHMAMALPKLVRPIAKSIFAFLLRRIASRCDWVTVVSQASYEFYRTTRTDGRVDFIYNSPRMELFPPCSHEVEGPITVVHEGHLDRQRGLVQMLEAVAKVRQSRDIRFLIVGDIRSKDQDLFDNKVAELGLADVMIIPGWKPYELIGRIESQAQIGLICHQYTPNSFLSLNNKMYNYMSCGQPVIAPVGSMTAHEIKKYNCGLCIDTSKPEEIAEAILKLAGDPELRKRLGANGRKAIERELGWHKMEERLERIYGQLAEELRG